MVFQEFPYWHPVEIFAGYDSGELRPKAAATRVNKASASRYIKKLLSKYFLNIRKYR